MDLAALEAVSAAHQMASIRDLAQAEVASEVLEAAVMVLI